MLRLMFDKIPFLAGWDSKNTQLSAELVNESHLRLSFVLFLFRADVINRGGLGGKDRYMLVSNLIQAGRNAELKKAAHDKQCRAKLFREYNLS